MTQREFIDFLGKVSALKSNTRHCYIAEGRRESVADHSWRLSLMAVLLERELEGIDMCKVIKMCIIHDLGEAVTGDIPTFVKTDCDREAEKNALDGLLSELPDRQREDISALFREMEELATPEAKLCKALDCMEAVISHNEAPLETWSQVEYTLNYTYGEKYVGFSDWLKELKRECNADTDEKLMREGAVLDNC